jgi:peptide deformylase
MPVRTITKMGHPVLRQPAREVDAAGLRSPEVRQLIDDMLETMQGANGAGLAAPQVFESLRILVAHRPVRKKEGEDEVDTSVVLVNPRILKASREGYADWEGCLSIPGIWGMVPRHHSIVVEAWDRDAKRVTLKAEGYFARILQHEIDHLDGILFLDRMEDMKTLTYTEELEKYWLTEEEGEESVEE